MKKKNLTTGWEGQNAGGGSQTFTSFSKRDAVSVKAVTAGAGVLSEFAVGGQASAGDFGGREFAGDVAMCCAGTMPLVGNDIIEVGIGVIDEIADLL